MVVPHLTIGTPFSLHRRVLRSVSGKMGIVNFETPNGSTSAERRATRAWENCLNMTR
jgi:hypothetical protein